MKNQSVPKTTWSWRHGPWGPLRPRWPRHPWCGDFPAADIARHVAGPGTRRHPPGPGPAAFPHTFDLTAGQVREIGGNLARGEVEGVGRSAGGQNLDDARVRAGHVAGDVGRRENGRSQHQGLLGRRGRP